MGGIGGTDAAVGVAGLMATGPTLAGWSPTQVRWVDGQPVVRWRFTEGVNFTDPFFDQTIDRCVRHPFRLLFWRETGVEALVDFATQSPGLEPAGFIFHMSRCGSTLMSQMFASLEQVLVLSEPGPVDQLLRTQTNCAAISDATVVAWLRGMISALGQPRTATQTRLVVKLDAWTVLHWRVIRRAFPATPCVFIYRDPVEVLISHLGHRGFHMVPGALPAGWFGLSRREVTSLSPEQYCAAVLACLCESGLDAARAGDVRLVHYGSLADAVPDSIAPVFGIDVGPSERAVFAEVAARDAKNPVLPFTPDGDLKLRRAGPAVHAASEARVGPVYRALEDLRLRGR